MCLVRIQLDTLESDMLNAELIHGTLCGPVHLISRLKLYESLNFGTFPDQSTVIFVSQPRLAYSSTASLCGLDRSIHLCRRHRGPGTTQRVRILNCLQFAKLGDPVIF